MGLDVGQVHAAVGSHLEGLDVAAEVDPVVRGARAVDTVEAIPRRAVARDPWRPAGDVLDDARGRDPADLAAVDLTVVVEEVERPVRADVQRHVPGVAGRRLLGGATVAAVGGVAGDVGVAEQRVDRPARVDAADDTVAGDEDGPVWRGSDVDVRAVQAGIACGARVTAGGPGVDALLAVAGEHRHHARVRVDAEQAVCVLVGEQEVTVREQVQVRRRIEVDGARVHRLVERAVPTDRHERRDRAPHAVGPVAACPSGVAAPAEVRDRPVRVDREQEVVLVHEVHRAVPGDGHEVGRDRGLVSRHPRLQAVGVEGQSTRVAGSADGLHRTAQDRSALRGPVAEVDDAGCRVVDVVIGERPSTETVDPGVEATQPCAVGAGRRGLDPCRDAAGADLDRAIDRREAEGACLSRRDGIDRLVHVGDAGGESLLALHGPSEPVPAVPGHGPALVRHGLVERPLVALARNRGRRLDANEPCRESVARHTQIQRACAPRDAVGAVLQRLPGAGKRDGLTQHLVLGLDRAVPGLDERVVGSGLLTVEGVEVLRRLGIVGRPHGVVEVDGGEVGDRHSPHGVAGVEQVGEGLPFGVGEGTGRRGRAVVRPAVAGRVDLGESAGGLLDDADDVAVELGVPRRLAAVVGTQRDDEPDGEPEELGAGGCVDVLQVHRDRLAELHRRVVGNPVDRELRGVRVGRRRRQLRRHGFGTTAADRVLGHAHVQWVRGIADRAVGFLDLGGRPTREQQVGGAGPVRVGDGGTGVNGDVAGGKVGEVDRRRGRIERGHDNVVDDGPVLPLHGDRALDRQQPVAGEVEGQYPTAVDRQVPAPVALCERVPGVAVAEDLDAHTADAAAVAVEHATGGDASSLRLEDTRVVDDLPRGVTGVEGGTGREGGGRTRGPAGRRVAQDAEVAVAWLAAPGLAGGDRDGHGDGLVVDRR